MPGFRLALSFLLAITSLASASASAQSQSDDALKLARAARTQVGVTRNYDPAYVRLAYPGGDVPVDRGVCSDVVIRAFRVAGAVDLQKLVHEDMLAKFSAYPKLWGLRRPDSNIDHRRVPNLQRFFERQGKALPVSDRANDYAAGDVVSWRLPNGLAHIGVVSEHRLAGPDARPLVIHNIGSGAREEDVLFAWPQTGHYRWFPETPRR